MYDAWAKKLTAALTAAVHASGAAPAATGSSSADPLLSPISAECFRIMHVAEQVPALAAIAAPVDASTACAFGGPSAEDAAAATYMISGVVTSKSSGSILAALAADIAAGTRLLQSATSHATEHALGGEESGAQSVPSGTTTPSMQSKSSASSPSPLSPLPPPPPARVAGSLTQLPHVSLWCASN
ncbi:hypothetical protein EON68_01575, partial [archaeon]